MHPSCALTYVRVARAAGAAVAVLFASLWPPTAALAATIQVTTTTVTPNPGAPDGQCSLVEALENARQQGQPFTDCTAGTAGGNTVALQAGQTYQLVGPIPTTSGANALALPFIVNAVEIDGNGAAITRAAGEYRVFYVAGGSLTLTDLTISNIVLPNTADGAIYNDNGAVTLTGVTIAGVGPVLGGTGGGAITSRANGGATAGLLITDSVLRNNSSLSAAGSFGTGGAVNTVAVDQGTATTTIRNTRISDNVATNQGGGISNAAYFNAGATAGTTIERSSVTGNRVTGLGGNGGFGGGIANFTNAVGATATLIVRNTTVTANDAQNGGYGGGIFHEAGCGQGNPCGQVDATLEHVALASNSAGREQTGLSRGGGIYVNDQSVAPGTQGPAVTTARNVLASGNIDSTGASANCRDVPLSLSRQGFNLASDATCGFNQATTGQIALGPLAVSTITFFQPLSQGSVAIDRVTPCSLNVDQIGNPRPRGNACDVGAFESAFTAQPPPRRPLDFDGNGVSDFAIRRLGVGPGGQALWWPRDVPGFPVPWPDVTGDVPVPLDYDGDAKTDIGFYRPSSSLWFGQRSSNGAVGPQLILGQSGDVPVPCNYNGDGRADIAIYRAGVVPSPGNSPQGLWFALDAVSGQVVLNSGTVFGGLGQVGDVPVPADYDGDGACDVAYFRPGSGLWFGLRASNGSVVLNSTVTTGPLGQAGDIAVPADYDGDGRADIAYFRPSNGLWFGLKAAGGGVALPAVVFGANGSIPVPADYDGDGRADIAFYDPPSGQILARPSGGGPTIVKAFGVAAGDAAVGKRPSLPGYPY